MIIRSLILLLPLSLWAAVFLGQRLSAREITASLLGFVWVFQASLGLNILAIETDTWTFLVEDNLFYGIPLDWIMAQSIVVGTLVPLSRNWGWSIIGRLLFQAVMLITIYCSIDLVFLKTASALLVLLLIFLSSGLALLLSDWTAKDIHIHGRAFFQSLAWAGLLFWLFPSIVFHLTADSWIALLQRDLLFNGLLFLPLLIPAYLLCNALYQFAEIGKGTAFPYDPPKRLVTTGVYRYISNPMQLGICLAMGWWGVILESLWVILSALVAVILFTVFKDVCNGSCTIGNDNQEWIDYQASVHKWWPR